MLTRDVSVCGKSGEARNDWHPCVKWKRRFYCISWAAMIRTRLYDIVRWLWERKMQSRCRRVMSICAMLHSTINADVMTPAQSSNSFVYDFRSLFSYSLCVDNLTQMRKFRANNDGFVNVLHERSPNRNRISRKRFSKKKEEEEERLHARLAKLDDTFYLSVDCDELKSRKNPIVSFRMVMVCCAFVLNVSRSIQFEVTERRKIDSNVWRPAKTHFLELKWRNSIWFGKAPSSNRETQWGEAIHATPFIAQISE